MPRKGLDNPQAKRDKGKKKKIRVINTEINKKSEVKNGKGECIKAAKRGIEKF